ncbi:MAG: PIN domain-containing protein [Proteobacteria bacterium]|nr:PIN domain-containing protein [Pseudomonadota bacterium]
MSQRTFIDTNVLIYADDAAAGLKRERARAVLRRLIGASQAVVSTQVLQEFFVIATKKLGVPADLARRKVERLAQLEVVLVRPELILGAIDLHRLHGISFWDALVLRSASAAGCTRVLTEDLNAGQVIDGVRVENPFAAR